MWILKRLEGDFQISLLPRDKNVTLGRKEVSVELSNDLTISRVHAVLDIQGRWHKLYVTDKGSKYGTFVNDFEVSKGIPPNTKVALKEGDRVRFGRMSYVFEVLKVEFVCAFSSLTSPHEKELRETIEFVGGKVVESLEGVKVSHLVMSRGNVTVKLLHVLVKGCCIVTIHFFRELKTAIEQRRAFPKEADFCPQFEDRFKDIDLNGEEIRVRRRTVFEGKMVYFISKRQQDVYKGIIEEAGGQCFCLRGEKVPLKKLVEENAIVVQVEDENFSQTQMSTSIREMITDIEKKLAVKGRRMIPISEIHLAITNGSCERNCNPKVSIFTPHPEPSQHSAHLLVPNTVDMSAFNANIPSSPVAILDTNMDEDDWEPVLQESDENKDANVPEKQPEAPAVEKNKVNSEVVEASQPVLQKRKISEVDSEVVEASQPVLQKRKISEVDSEVVEASQPTPQKIIKTRERETSSWVSKTVTDGGDSEQPSQSQRGTQSRTSKRRNRQDSDSDEEVGFGFRTKKARTKKVAESVFNYSTKPRTQRRKSPVPEKPAVQKPVAVSLEAALNAGVRKFEHLYQPKEESFWRSKSRFCDTEVKDEPDGGDPETKAYVQKFIDGFQVSVKKMDLSASSSVTSVSASASSFSGRNFKAFVKKKNYQAQTKVVETKGVQIVGSQYS